MLWRVIRDLKFCAHVIILSKVFFSLCKCSEKVVIIMYLEPLFICMRSVTWASNLRPFVFPSTLFRMNEVTKNNWVSKKPAKSLNFTCSRSANFNSSFVLRTTD